MSYRPFLSHKRKHQEVVRLLKRELQARGAGGWKDTDDLRLGRPFKRGLKRAIKRETGGFIWWATKDTLDSPVIRKTELPVGLRRARRERAYPFVPVFVELRPGDGEDMAAIAAAIGKRRADQMLDLNGVVPEPTETEEALARRVAREYLHQMVEGLPPGRVDIAVTAFRAPTEQHDITLDWRGLFDAELREPHRGAAATFVESLADVRDGLQRRDGAPALCVDVNLPLPLAILLGYEWRNTTQLRVTIQADQGANPPLLVAPSTATNYEWPEPRAEDLPGDGPYVLAISVDRTLGDAVGRYAERQDASAFEHVHVPGRLDADGVRDLAAHVAGRLSALHSDGKSKHLLLQCPAALAAAIGLAANGTGPTWVPFWDGHDDYVSGVHIG